MAGPAPAKPFNIHATALVVGETGMLIVGKSGSGKSETARALLRSAKDSGRFAALVADDQVLLETAADRTIAVAPASTAGLMEMRGSAITAIAHLPRAVMHMVVSLDPSDEQPRLPDPEDRYRLENGSELPLLRFQPGGSNNLLDLVEAFEKNGLLR